VDHKVNAYINIPAVSYSHSMPAMKQCYSYKSEGAWWL